MLHLGFEPTTFRVGKCFNSMIWCQKHDGNYDAVFFDIVENNPKNVLKIKKLFSNRTVPHCISINLLGLIWINLSNNSPKCCRVVIFV